MQTLTIRGELTDLNAYIKSLNASRWVGAGIKRDETEVVAYVARAAKMKPVAKYPVRIAYRWYCKDNRKDVDNVAFAKKFINDGLVAARVLEDDSRKYVAGFTDDFYIDKENPRVEIDIVPMVK